MYEVNRFFLDEENISEKGFAVEVEPGHIKSKRRKSNSTPDLCKLRYDIDWMNSVKF